MIFTQDSYVVKVLTLGLPENHMLYEYLEVNTEPDYRDTVLEEDLFSEGALEELSFVENDFTEDVKELREVMAKHDCAYVRFVNL